METVSEPVAPRTEAESNGVGDEPKSAADEPKEGSAKPAAKAPERTARAVVSGQIDDLVAVVRRLEAFASDEAKRVSDKILPQVETQAKKNIWVTILLAIGLGLIFGLWLGGGRRRD